MTEPWVRVCLICLTASLLVGYPVAALGATYYVATTGVDVNPGTQSQPWRTIQRAANMAQAGDTVNVGGGVYAEKLTFTRSGAAGSPITFRSSPAGAAIINGTGVTVGQYNALVEITTASYLTLDGFEICNSQSYNVIVMDVTHTKLLNLDVHNTGGRTQIDINGPLTRPAFSVISGCKVHDGPGGGICLWNTPGGYWLVENNEVYNNVGASNYDGIQVEGAAGGAHHVVVKNNKIHDNGGPNAGEDNLDLTSARLTHHYLVEGNDIYGSIGAFKLHSGRTYTPGVSSFHIARFNRFTRIPYNCYNYPDPIVVYNNTFVDGGQFVKFYGTSGVVSSMGDSTYSGGDTGRMNWKNNIFFQQAASSAYALLTGPSNGSIDVTYSSVRFQHSLYRLTSQRMIWGSVYAYYNPMTAASFAAYQASGAPNYPDTESIFTTATGDQTFVGYAARDYHLVVGSPAIDKGTPLTTAKNAGANSTTLVVDRASYFHDGFPVNGEYLNTPDSIVIGSNAPVAIVSIDDPANTITLASPVSWSVGDSVTLPYRGSAPDIGAFELETANAPIVTAATPSKSMTPTWTWSSGGGGGNGVFRYQLDSEAGPWTQASGTNSHTPETPLNDGAHTLYVQEQSAAGSWSASGSFTVTVDTTAPTVGTLQSPEVTNQLPIVVTYSGVSDATTGVKQVRLWMKENESGVWTDTGLRSTSAPSGSFSISNISRDAYYWFFTQVEDNAGNLSPEPTDDLVFQSGAKSVRVP